MKNNLRYKIIDDKKVPVLTNTVPIKKILFSKVQVGNKRGCASGKCGITNTQNKNNNEKEQSKI